MTAQNPPIITQAEFVTSAAKFTQYPSPDRPEIAFSGRSNVGKSTLINTLLNRKRLVKTGNTPGRTQLINYFNINGFIKNSPSEDSRGRKEGVSPPRKGEQPASRVSRFRFVDLPGYGYARAPQKIKKHWGPMIETYLTRRETLAAVVLLLDIRRTPSDQDREILRWLFYFEKSVIPVLTKTDKLSKSNQTKQLSLISRFMGIAVDEPVLFSAKNKMGKAALWHRLRPFINLGGNGI